MQHLVCAVYIVIKIVPFILLCFDLKTCEPPCLYTVWRVIFGGANIHEKSKVAVRINFRFVTHWMTNVYYMRIRYTWHVRMVCMHTPSAMCVLLTIELAAVPTLFAELWSIDSWVRSYHVYNGVSSFLC